WVQRAYAAERRIRELEAILATRPEAGDEPSHGALNLAEQLQDLGHEFGCPAGIKIMDWLRIKLIATRAGTESEKTPPELTEREIEAGWHQTFSTSNPYCPCNLKSFTKAVRWAERAAMQQGKSGSEGGAA
ncbi:MAG: hypothetical protein ACREMA_20800, partial [Longimicrobiales bacterium]